MYVCIASLFADSARAQVTIGALDKPARGALLDLNPQSAANLGGLLFLNIFITNTDSLPASLPGSFTPAEQDYFLDLQGMVVYNTNPDLAGGEGLFVWDGGKWEKTGADASFATSCPADAISPAGGSVTCSISDPACTSGGEYSFSFIVGAEYAQLNITDAGAGQFTLTIDANDRASSRSVILLVTSPCGKSQTFVYTQDGDTSGCNPATVAPKILGENTTGICSGGAAYLYLDGRPSGVYIWTRNGVQVATGTVYVAEQSGKYIVYADKIGCTTVKPDTLIVSVGSTSSPQPVVSIVAENNGYICAATETVQLFATAPGSGTIRWYRDGVRQSATGSPIDAGEGEWFAVVEDGACSSTPSNTIHVQLDPNSGSGSIITPVIQVNGSAAGSTVSVCAGGTMNLSVAAPVAGETYTWYINNTQIGIGKEISYNLGSAADPFVLRCRATGANACSKEAISEASVSLDSAPATPYISVNTPGDAICGGSATLSANGSSATSYNWYRADTENGIYTKIAGQSAQTLDIAQPGFYKAEAINGSCVSARSLAKNISTVSGAAAVTISGAQTGNPGDIITFTAAMNNPQGATYSWTASSPAVVQGLSTGSQFVVSFPTDGSYTVSLVASNACGTAPVTNNNYPVTIAPACNSASILSHSPASKSASTIFNVGTSISVSAAGSPTLSYEWYKTTTAVASGGTKVGSASLYSTPTDLAEGTHYYYCIVTSSCDNSTATSDVFTVTVNPDPATLPTGTGSFAGRTCFDVAQTNDGGDCGALASRQAETLSANGARADFSQTITNTQTYTFTPSGTVSNVRFMQWKPRHIPDRLSRALRRRLIIREQISRRLQA
ncbi:MAG: PKD domain-containing protein [Dysgonamonadaceae bacterium]|jgi:hypothetical protein|nr:PKD domain-containing protein [Dysgonamonadaceae bacterium]